ncbi:MAG TPA: PilT/PilU family type 4a pilus ATPase [Gammaproteobacteria bacterium]
MDFVDLLKLCVEKKGSDIFITAGAPPSLKVNGVVTPMTDKPLNPEAARKVVYDIMNDKQRSEFEQSNECNFAISAAGVGRFRVNVFVQRSNVGMVLRRIETTIPTLEQLKLPQQLKEIAMTKRGMVLFVGGTGTGKSTSLAAMIGFRNQNSKGHIITIEDPIEYVHQHAGCIVTQREVGVDTDSFDVALKNTLRQAPDVILVGEIRHQETMEYAIAFAETGHLVLATLHANNANQAMDRIINFFPEERHKQLFMDLSLNLKAVIAQMLIPRKDGKGRRAAIEILINTPLASDLIQKGEVHEIKSLMKQSRENGMQTFDQALFDLYKEGEISREDALQFADSANEVRLMIKLDQSAGDPRKFSEGLDKLSIEDGDDESFMRM